MKRQATADWERILANHISNKKLVSRIYKETSNSTVKKQTISLEKGKKHHIHFTKKVYTGSK